MDSRTLSSAQTFYWKYIFPVAWISWPGIETLAPFARVFYKGDTSPPEAMEWTFLAMWVAVTTFILWFLARFKRVRLDRRFLYVSNYLREISIPLHMIDRVTEIRGMNIHPVT